MLRIDSLSKTYRNEQGELPTLKDISLSVAKGEFVGLPAVGKARCLT